MKYKLPILSLIVFSLIFGIQHTSALELTKNIIRSNIYNAYNDSNWPALKNASQVAIDNMPDNALGHYYMGVALFELCDFYNSAQAYTRAIEISPKTVQNYIGRGMAYMNGGNITDAVKDFEHALQLQPANTDVKELLASAVEKSSNDDYQLIARTPDTLPVREYTLDISKNRSTYLPGHSLAGKNIADRLIPRLKGYIPIAMGESCNDIAITQAEVIKQPFFKGTSFYTAKGGWNEIWVFSACNRTVAVPVYFDLENGMVNAHYSNQEIIVK